MPTDPLLLSVDHWTRSDLDILVGRRESLRLELKGSETDITAGAERRSIAREIAAMQSEAGGFVVIGTEAGSDAVTAYPGLDVALDEVENLRRSLLDLVRPVSLIRGPVALPADDADRAILVIEVSPHPLALPAFTSNRFWIRVEDEARPMTYEEVRRRFEVVETDLNPMRNRGRAALSEVAVPITEAVRAAAAERGLDDPQYQPIAVALVPRHPSVDFGRSGRQLRDALRRIGDAEHAVSRSSGLDEHGSAIHDDAIATSRGAMVSHAPFTVLQFGHDSVFAMSVLGILDPWAGYSGQALDPRHVEAVLVRSVAVGLRMITEAAGPSEVLVLATSGTIPGAIHRSTAGPLPLPVDPARDVGATANLEFVTPSRGQQAVEAVASGAGLLAQRINDAGTFDGVHAQEPFVATYLEAMLNA